MAKKKKKPAMPTVPRDHDEASYSELVPFKSTKINLKKSPLMLFGIITAIIVPFLFGLMGQVLDGSDPAARQQAFMLQAIAAVFYILVIMLVALFVYSRSKRPFWHYGLVFVAVAVIVSTPLFSILVFPFRNIIPGIMQMGLSQTSVIQAFIGMFFIAGLAEEWVKAVPILGAAWLAFKVIKNPAEDKGFASKFKLTGPVDGVVMGMFAGAGFIFSETAFQYVPEIYTNITKQVGDQSVGMLGGLSLLLPRVFGGITGHMGYSAIVGYFIGLAVIRPKNMWKLILTGWLAASLIHALWNSFGSQYPIFQYPIAIMTVVFAIAALLKGRQIDAIASGTVDASSGSIIVERPRKAKSQPPTAAPVHTPAPPKQAAPPASTAKVEGPIALNVNGVMIPLRAGENIDLGDEPALEGKGAGIMGAIVPHPTRANVLGLRNSGQGSWTANLRDGSQQMIENGQNIRLAPGVSIDFGNGLIGSVQALG